METVTTILLIAGAIILGLTMLVWGIRGAIREWRDELPQKINAKKGS
jgi:hypothetical protein